MAAYRTMSTHARSWRRSDIAGENRSREGIHDGNHVKRTLDFRDAMFYDVADIDAPSLMASSRLERVKLWLVWLFWGRLDAIELTILGHNAATGSRGNRNPELLERRDLDVSISNSKAGNRVGNWPRFYPRPDTRSFGASRRDRDSFANCSCPGTFNIVVLTVLPTPAQIPLKSPCFPSRFSWRMCGVGVGSSQLRTSDRVDLSSFSQPRKEVPGPCWSHYGCALELEGLSEAKSGFGPG